ncbi:hypothetical protein B0A50_00063 [Salinomyces thailandicus]|uniref:Copper homeostasis protein cutC homolog n=1 Tax=Salinomyces thailandicus TaxID=706561 RepID=A0A4U0UEX9_9PEZI|nr:hypothetical protein B0A50_00063 [Salinomyces thailandica]
MAFLEIACFAPEHAILAYEAGADRIELCDNKEAGGTTPPLDWLYKVQKHVSIPVYVMIRPRGGDFHYTDAEYAQMKNQIQAFKNQKADGYVFGMLSSDLKVDVARTAELIRLAHLLPCTFHKAFDEAADAFEAFEDVIEAGFSTILTSGGAASAMAGIDVLGQLVRMSRMREIAIMPGGGIRATTIAAVKGWTRASVFHSAAVPNGAQKPCAKEIRLMKELIAGYTSDKTLAETIESANSVGSSTHAVEERNPV